MKRSLALLVLMSLLILPASAGGEGLEQGLNVDEIRSQTETAAEIPLDDPADLDGSLAQLWGRLTDELADALSESTRSGGLILMIALLSSLIRCLWDGGGGTVSRLAGTLAVTGAAMGDMSSLMELGRETVSNLNGFTRLLVPAMTTAAAAAGSVTGAAARQSLTLLLSNLLLSVTEGVLIPLLYFYVAVSAGAEALGQPGLQAMGDFVKWLIRTGLTWMLLAYTAYLSLGGVIAGTADRAAVKMARFAISGMVPVVGGILSDASESVLAGAGLIRNTIGILGTVGVLGFCIGPFLRLGVRYLIYRMVAVLTSAMTEEPVSRLIRRIGDAFGLLLGMTGAAALVTLISIVSTLTVAVS